MTVKSDYTFLETIKQNHKSSFVRVYRNNDHKKFIFKIPEIRNDRNLKNEFQQEFDITHNLQIDSVLSSQSFENYLGQQVLLYENFNGVFLSDLFSENDSCSIEFFLEYAVKIAEALSDIHNHKIIHKDVRPDNIIIDLDTGKVKFTGFGNSTKLIREVPTVEANKILAEALPYISPEQTGLLKRSVDNRSDLYSLGITFFWMLTKKFPFEAIDPLEWIHCHIARQPASVENFRKDVPEMILKIISMLMGKMSDDRYQTTSGLCHDLALCVESWHKENKISSFLLGLNDISGKFIVPSKIYGREKEKSILINQFKEFTQSGQIQLCLISGYSGIGKSSLFRELYFPVIESGGHVIAGKFDQNKKNTPFSTIVQAFHELINTILIDTEEKINEWKLKLLNALKGNGQLIVEVIPQIELLIGKQPAVQELPPMEAQNRFRKVFRNFISAFAFKEQPLVLFLDDLQWADTGSLELIRDLFINNSQYLFIVGAYRDNEVNETHPLVVIINELKKININISEISLAQLSKEHLTAFIADALHCSLSDALPLVHLLYDKTAGNPFFVIQFMTSLYEEGLLTYDIEYKKWKWDIEKIFQKGLTENVIDLIIKKIKRLPEVTQSQLEQLSCFGESVEIDILKMVLGQDENQLQENFLEAINNGIVAFSGGKYKFLHDRIQEAAYLLLSPIQSKKSHLKIARILLSKLSSDERKKRIFEIADQFNKALDLLNESELQDVMELNLQAAIKARKATAFKTTIFYAECGIKCFFNLKPAFDNSEVAFQLHYLKIQSEVAIGNSKLAQKELMPLLSVVTERRQKALLLQIQVEIFTLENKTREAIEIALECLKLYDISMPLRPDNELVEELVSNVEKQIRKVGLDFIVQIPIVNNSEIEIVMGLMASTLPNAYFFNNNLHRMVSAQMINLTLEQGVCALSAMGFAAFGLDSCGLGKYKESKQYGDIAYAIMDKHNFESIKAKVCNIIGASISPWNDKLNVAIDYLIQGTLAEGGDTIFASLCKLYILMLKFEAGESLDGLILLAEESMKYINAQGFSPLNVALKISQRFMMLLQGKTDGPTSFSDKDLDENIWVEEIQKTALPLMMSWYHFFKLQAGVYFNDADFSLEQIKKCERLIPLLKGQQAEADFAFFSALAIIKAWPEKMPNEWKARLLLYEKRLEHWSTINEANFSGRFFLVQAEIAKMAGKNWEAASFYQQSIKSSRTFGFMQIEALAYEKAAEFYQSQGFETFADNYYREAYSAYKVWGAYGKLDHLEKKYPALKNKKLIANSALSVQLVDFDFYSTIKASQAISGKIDFDKLIKELLNITLEQSGAQKGILLLHRQNNVYIEALAYVHKNEIVSEVQNPILFENADNLPLSIIRYVLRSKEKIIYNDKDNDENKTLFSTDAYIKKHFPKSILCLPILRNNELEGILYLENNLISGVFSPERLAVLELIASQSAISLQNAQLFKTLREEINQRERVEEALQAALVEAEKSIAARDNFIAIASHELRTPITPLKIYIDILKEQLKDISPDMHPQFSSIAKAISKSDQSLSRLTRLTEDLLDVSRIQSGQYVLDKHLFNLCDLVKEVIERVVTDKKIDPDLIKFKSSGEVVGNWDQLKIDQLVENLVSNAVKYGLGKRIDISIIKSKNKAIFSVKDNGIGIDVKNQSTIFERFGRAVSIRNFEGLGLGLYIVKEIVSAHDGTIRVESELGAGSKFVVELPL